VSGDVYAGYGKAGTCLRGRRGIKVGCMDRGRNAVTGENRGQAV